MQSHRIVATGVCAPTRAPLPTQTTITSRRPRPRGCFLGAETQVKNYRCISIALSLSPVLLFFCFFFYITLSNDNESYLLTIRNDTNICAVDYTLISGIISLCTYSNRIQPAETAHFSSSRKRRIVAL